MSVRQIRDRAEVVLSRPSQRRPRWTSRDAKDVVWLANFADQTRETLNAVAKLLTDEQRRTVFAESLALPPKEIPDAIVRTIGLSAPSDTNFERGVELAKERGWKDVRP